MSTAPPIPDTPDHCRRCGTCCLKGGPVLHREDLELVQKGAIPLRNLITICPGEPVHDNVRGEIGSVEEDRIKIQPRSGSTACRYYAAAESACAIYASRPVQCRVLKCWDPAALRALYDENHLTRREILGTIPGLWDLVETHTRRCDSRAIARRAARFLAQAESGEIAEAKILESLRYDQSLRDLIQAQGRPDPNLLPFLLGRPLLQRLRPLRLRLVRTAGQYRLVAL